MEFKDKLELTNWVNTNTIQILMEGMGTRWLEMNFISIGVLTVHGRYVTNMYLVNLNIHVQAQSDISKM